MAKVPTETPRRAARVRRRTVGSAPVVRIAVVGGGSRHWAPSILTDLANAPALVDAEVVALRAADDVPRLPSGELVVLVIEAVVVGRAGSPSTCRTRATSETSPTARSSR
jgi:predicted metal-dependent RNase